jgi:hypothetical protein
MKLCNQNCNYPDIVALLAFPSIPHKSGILIQPTNYLVGMYVHFEKALYQKL